MTTEALLRAGPADVLDCRCDRDDFVAWLNMKLTSLSLDALYSSYLVSMLEQGADASSFIRNLADGDVSPQVKHALLIINLRLHRAWPSHVIIAASHLNIWCRRILLCVLHCNLFAQQALDALISELWQRWYGEDAAAGTVFAPGEPLNATHCNTQSYVSSVHMCAHISSKSALEFD
jgi:hypothetical protein